MLDKDLCDKKYAQQIKQENISIFSDSITSRIKMYSFNTVLKNGDTKYLSFPGTLSKKLLQYLDVNLKMYAFNIVFIDVGINNVLNENLKTF